MNKWRVHKYEREQYDVIEFDDNDRQTGASLYCGHSEVGKLLAERIAKLFDLEKAVAKMSHRRCWECKHVAYYLDLFDRCEECGSADTRRIWTDHELARKEVDRDATNIG